MVWGGWCVTTLQIMKENLLVSALDKPKPGFSQGPWVPPLLRVNLGPALCHIWQIYVTHFHLVWTGNQIKLGSFCNVPHCGILPLFGPETQNITHKLGSHSKIWKAEMAMKWRLWHIRGDLQSHSKGSILEVGVKLLWVCKSLSYSC